MRPRCKKWENNLSFSYKDYFSLSFSWFLLFVSYYSVIVMKIFLVVVTKISLLPSRPTIRNVASYSVKFSDTRYRAMGGLGPGADPGVQAVSTQVTISHPPAVGCRYLPPGLRFTSVNVHQMAPPLTEVTGIILQLTLHLSTPK